MIDISKRVDLKLSEDVLAYVRSKMASESRRAMLEEELEVVLKKVLLGLEELDSFVEAVEWLAVTTPHVFRDEVFKLPDGVSCCDVKLAIGGARQACPLAMEFKRDAKVFFLPKLDNVQVLIYMLDKYIQTTLNMCLLLNKSKFCLNMTMKAALDLGVELHVDLPAVDRMLHHINTCDNIRKDANFRLVFMLQDAASRRFVMEFSQRRSRMLELLDELDQSASDLVRMNRAKKISSVVGSSVGVVSGVLSITGLAMSPASGGASLILSMVALGLGLSGFASCIAVSATDFTINQKHKNKASEVFENFMQDVQCLDDATREAGRLDMAVNAVLCQVDAVERVASLHVDATSTTKTLKSNQVVTRIGKVVVQGGKAFRNVHKMVADVQRVSQTAARSSLLALRTAKAGLIPLNGIFVGLDVFIICMNGVALVKGCHTDVSRFIRARTALWRSEMDLWQRISDSLVQGMLSLEKNQAVMEAEFYKDDQQEERRHCVIQ
ncbi:apolipoprotein L2 [Dunckerocampus dactyliophorus]|uniref:apolipoprotein L2 n=1 Tax=Dunckerocampus dactyliophorus TaxID=161453 RepID=UPI0024070706|nr:apolipoprotein L2 [Dunckerocampus dactyliophorus]